MKHLIYKILIIILLIPFASLGQDSLVKKSGITGSDTFYLTDSNNFLTSANFSKDALQKIIARRQAEENCPGDQSSAGKCAHVTTRNCGLGTDFCNDTVCIGKILCCHAIDTATFNIMTLSGKSGYAPFHRKKIRRMLKNASCDRQRIRFRIDENDTYILTRVDTSSLQSTRSAGINRETYYSIALLQGIYNKRTRSGLFKLNKRIKSISVYRGVNVPKQNDDDPNKLYNLIPFIVTFGDGSVGYFDVSETQP